MKLEKIKYLFFLMAFIIIQGCGIKGAPIPPQKPFYIGEGNKKIKNASEEEKNYKKVKKNNKGNNNEI